MPAFKIALLGLLCFFSLALGSKCPQDAISKLVVCYYKGEISLTKFNICNCTHVIFTNAVRRIENYNISATEDTIKHLELIKEKKKNLSTLFTLEAKQDESSKILKSENKSQQLINGIVEFLQTSQFDGVELNFKFGSNDGVSKESYSSFVKDLSKILSSRHRRIKRDGYDVFEKVQDDVTTVAYTTQTPKNSTSKTQSIKRKSRKPKENSRKIREKKEEDDDDESDKDYLTLEEAINAEFSEQNPEKQNTLKDVEEEFSVENKFLVFVRLSIKPEIIAKKYDLKVLSRYADILTVPTHHIVNDNEDRLTYHPSRLMGLSDILNTDSVLDFLTGMGALKSKMVITLPATVLKFQLTDENKNTPRSPSESKPRVIDQSQLCSLFSKSNWTVERDDDLTAPYAFSGKTWLAFEDGISINIKGKYILLRELAGGAIYPIDSDLNDGVCSNLTGSSGYLTGVLYKNFESLERKPRALVLESLQEEIHDTSLINIEAGIKLSEYRIVRVVDHTGAVHVIRKNTKTQFECSRQGYFSHPLGCNKFYRCVKFDQYSDEFTVFEYDCPAGLAFDERWEVCVWPGSLPHGAPCTGSSEIAPVPRSHYQCPGQEGYYADPENCRWFFACLDHARDGITPLTAYEFRCPFGLVFSEQKLACDWPWLVGSCGSRGAAGYLNIYSAGQSQGIHTATFINGGNLEASFGQYGNADEENSFINFGKKFGSTLKETNTNNAQGSYQGAQSAGFGYIASQFDDKNSRGSFAAFPDYEISGGRIFNKGGVVLDQNIAGISDTLAGGIEKGLEDIFVRGGVAGESRSLDKEAGYLHQNIFPSTGGGQEISSKNTQKLESFRTNVLNLSVGQVAVQNSIPTPRPFSVSIPSVQINSEKSLKYSGHSPVGSTTPQTLLIKETPSTENINHQFTNIKLSNENQYSKSQKFTVSQPAVIPVVTPTTETHSFGRTVSEGFDSSQIRSGEALSTPSVYFDSTSQREESHGINRFNVKQDKFSNKIFLNEAAVSVGVPAVTSTHSFEYNAGEFGGKTVHEPVSTLLPVVTPKPVVHTFEYTAGGSDDSQPFISTESPFVGFTQQQQITDQSNTGKILQNSANILTKVPAVKANIFTNVIEQQNFNSEKAIAKPEISYGAPLVTLTPSISTKAIKSGLELERLPVVSSGPAVTGFVHSSIDEKVSNEIRFQKPQSSFEVPASTPKTKFQYLSKTGSDEYFGELSGVSKEIPVVTPKANFQILSQPELNLKGVTGKSESITLVTPQPDLNPVKYSGGSAIATGVTPIVPFESPKISGTIKSSFGQSYIPVTTPQSSVNTFGQNYLLQKELLQKKTSYSIPNISSKTNTNGIGQTGGVSQIQVTPKFDIKISQAGQPIFGQRYSHSFFKPSEIQFGSIQPFGTVNSTPKPKTEILEQKVDQPNTLTEITIEQQPIVSIGTVSSTSIEQTLSTPRPLSFSDDKFSQSAPTQNFNIKPNNVQPQPVAVSTSAPGISTTLSTNDFVKVPQSLNVEIISKFPQTYKQQEKINLKTFSPAHQQAVVNIPFNGQKSNIKQEIKSFSPAAPYTRVTTSIPFTYKQEITSGVDTSSSFFGKSNAYLPPVTSKPETFGSIIQQEQPAPVVNQQLEFLKTKPLSEERTTQFIQHLPVQVGTVVPENQHQVKIEQTSGPAVSTSKPFTPREELVGLEISKSIEINPSQFFELEKGLPLKLPDKTVEIQQQSLHLISQKTFPIKQSQVIQPFYTQRDKDIVHPLNHSPENKFHEPLIFQQQTNTDTPTTEILKQKQYLSPAITAKPQIYSTRYSTTKDVNVEQPVVYSEGNVNVAPAFPVFEATAIPLTEQKETTILKTKNNYYQPAVGFVRSSAKSPFIEHFDSRQPQEIVSSRLNLLSPISTEATRLAVSKTDELLVQTHNAFDSQKVNGFGTIPRETDFVHSEIQSTLKPVVSNFEASGYPFQFHKAQNFTSGGNSGASSGIKYAINPKIEIPEPPREYILAQNGFTTPTPDSGASLIQFTSKSSEPKNRYEGLSHLSLQVSPRKKSSKITVTTSGSLNEEEFRGDNIQQFFDKYSGRFGEVINGKNAKAVKGYGEGDIAGHREASSTVRYEVSSTKPSLGSRRRQYHGGITSGIPATNKYEEYDLNGNKNSQKSFEIDSGEENKSTLDLKNLKLDSNKKTVIVVSQVSDANPVLIGKLAGQCSCQSNMLELRGKGKKSKNNSRRKNSQNQYPQATIINEYLPPFESNQPTKKQEALTRGKTPSADLEAVVTSKPFRQGVSYTAEQNLVSSSTTVHPDLISSTILSSLGPDGVLSITPKAIFSEERIKNKNKQFRGRTRYLQPSSAPSEDGVSIPLLSPVPASEIASTFDYSVLRGDESRTQNEIDKGKDEGISKLAAGAAYERYGPGGWRGFDETLQGSIDCKRPGLFRHPKYCNKFYACNYDPWKERYTLHVFNCPIHLTYDSSISACNWPIRGPACADDNLLV